MSLSCLIIARNEEKNLEKCLSNLIFTDEIVVVLDRSIDNSKEISCLLYTSPSPRDV